MKRRILNLIAALLLVLLAIIWVRSYRAVDSIEYSWVAPRGDDHVIRIACGWYQGRLGFGYTTEPVAWGNYLATVAKIPLNLSRSFHRRIYRHPFAASWRDLWFDSESYSSTIPANADGTIAVLTNGQLDRNAPRRLARSDKTFGIPLWLPIVLIAAAPVSQLINLPARRRRLRHSAGQCVACGYDLRATPDRCPECGAVPDIFQNQPSLSHRILRSSIQFGARLLTVRSIAAAALFALALISSLAICQYFYLAVFLHQHLGFMQNWTTINQQIACTMFCAMAIIWSSVISLLLFDGLRRRFW